MAEARVARKRTAARKAPADVKAKVEQPKTIEAPPWEPQLLDVGDKVEVGATVEVKDGQGRTIWPKANTQVTVRQGETADEAVARAQSVTMGILTAAISDFED